MILKLVVISATARVSFTVVLAAVIVIERLVYKGVFPFTNI